MESRLPFLKLLFAYVAQINPKKKYYKYKWIQSCDFRDFLVECNLVTEEFVERDCYLAFLQSMMT